MTLIKFKNEAPSRVNSRMPYFSDLFNELFENSLNSDFRKSTLPAVNIIESDENYKLQLAAPGLKKEDFKVNIENDMLTISVEKKTESSEKNEKYTRREYSYNSFVRSFTLPEFVDADKISANYADGLMTIELPKKEEARPKAPRAIQVS